MASAHHRLTQRRALLVCITLRSQRALTALAACAARVRPPIF